MSKRLMPWALIALLTLAGCATTQPVEEEPADEPTADADADADAETEAEAEAEREAREAEEERVQLMGGADCPPTCEFPRTAIDNPESALSDRTIYFEFDASTVQNEYMDVIQRHAAYLAQYPNIEVRVEGHADERGSREYNIGLGARRSDAVSRLLQVNGASASQIETVSYGEEVPAVEGSNESAWSKNRRVELVYPSVSN